MLKKSAVLTIALALAPVAAFAVDGKAVLGSAIGAAAGTAIGSELGGREGAIIGGGIGGATGAAIGSKDSQKTTTSTRVVEKQVVVVYDNDDHRHSGKHKRKHRDNGNHYGQRGRGD